VTGDAVALFDQAPAAYVVLDRADGRILQANQAFLDLVRRPVAEVLASTFSDMVGVAGRIYTETHLMPMLDLTGRVDEVALDVVVDGGDRLPVLLNANLDRSGDRATVRVVLFEARERRRYESELLRVTREAEQARRQAVDLVATLQQTLVPPVLPQIPRLGVWATYRPAGAGDEVGGDFYDVFSIGPLQWMVVLGDVVGKGIPAATVTSFIRHALRDLAMQIADPAELLHALDRAMRAAASEKFCTAVVLRLTETEDGWAVSGAVGGHPLPLLGTRDGTVTELGRPGSLIGLLDDPHYSTFTHRLVAGEFVTVFTDGVTEAQRGPDLLGDRALHDLVRAASQDPSTVSEGLVRAAVAFQAGHPRDDIAVLTLHPS
jgi:sigma-B regulation protein RsbU (phosphoserine phosphatase)